MTDETPHDDEQPQSDTRTPAAAAEPTTQDATPDAASDGDDPYADPGELTVKRDESGELLPVDKETTFGMVQVTPMPYGAIERQFGDTGQVADVGAEQIAEVLRDHVHRPDLETMAQEHGYPRFTTAFVREELKPLVPRDLILAILDASDVEADVAMEGSGNAQVSIDESGNRT